MAAMFRTNYAAILNTALAWKIALRFENFITNVIPPVIVIHLVFVAVSMKILFPVSFLKSSRVMVVFISVE